MKQALKSYLLVACLAALCLAAPAGLAACYDRVTLGHVETAFVEPVTLGVTSGLTLIDKLRIVQEGMMLETGGETRMMTADAASTAAGEAINGLLEAFGLSALTPSETDARPMLLMSDADARRSFPVWEIPVETDRYYGQLTLDDETGKLLRFSLTSQQSLLTSNEKTVVFDTDDKNYAFSTDSYNLTADLLEKLAEQLGAHWGMPALDGGVLEESTDKSGFSVTVIVSYGNGTDTVKALLRCSPYQSYFSCNTVQEVRQKYAP